MFDEQKLYSVYFIATPIGNLNEITLRALEILKAVDIVFCEDTRQTVKLFKEHGIEKPLVSYHKFNEKARCAEIVEAAMSGRRVAVVSDAGMPCISDPGSILVNELIAQGIGYTVVSGASALINAFVLSGFQPPFTFIGFLPDKTSERKDLLERYDRAGCLLIYSSPYDVNSDLQCLFSLLGARRVAVVKELTKLYERVQFGVLGEITVENPKGEFVIVVDRGETKVSGTPEETVNRLIAEGMEQREAIKTAAKLHGIPRQEVYKLFSND